jgi:hypothetical protein
VPPQLKEGKPIFWISLTWIICVLILIYAMVPEGNWSSFVKSLSLFALLTISLFVVATASLNALHNRTKAKPNYQEAKTAVD